MWACSEFVPPEVCVSFGAPVYAVLDVPTCVALARQVDRYLDGPGGPGTLVAVEHRGSVHLTGVGRGNVVADVVGPDGSSDRRMTGALALRDMVYDLYEAARTLGWNEAAEAA